MEHSTLKGLVHYCPETGIFSLLVPSHRRPAGTRVDRSRQSAARKQPWTVVNFGGRSFIASRLAWFYMTGEWPSNEIDHLDGNPLNNRWGNLRPATRSQNQANTKVYKSNRLGLKGVYRIKNKYRAMAQKDHRRFSLGYFDTPEEAATAYQIAAKSLHGEFVRTA